MTANYFLLTRDGADLSGLDFPAPVQGSGPTTVDVSDGTNLPVLVTRRNLIPNPSFEVDTTGWAGNVATLARVTTEHQTGAAALRLTSTGTSAVFATTPAGTAGMPVTAGEQYTASFYAKAATVGRTVYANLEWYSDTGLVLSGTAIASAVSSTGGWTRVTVTGTAPANAAYASLNMNPSGVANGEVHYFDAVLLEQASSAGTYFDGDTPDDGDTLYGWTGTAHASASTESTSTLGVPGDLDGVPGLWLDAEADVAYRPTEQSMPWPTGFYQSVFRVVRDPAVVGDDSGDPLADQIYNHGWLIAERLAWYLLDTRKRATPEQPLTWPPAETLAVVPVTGTSACDDGRGWHGLTATTWPGAGVGVGTLRQLLSADEDSTHKVAPILDLLAATSSGQRTTIGDNYDTNVAAILTAYQNLATAAGWPVTSGGWPYTGRSAAQNQYMGREALNAFLARGAVGEDLWSNSSLSRAVSFALMAITAKEAGLIGATFTETNYQTMTGPIDAVLTMPSGY